MIKRFYEKVLDDDLLNNVFKTCHLNIRNMLPILLLKYSEGRPLYSESDNGSHAIMISHHLGKMLTEDQRKRWMQLLLETADEIGLATDPEFRSALVGYLEWGGRIAVINSTERITL
ncbi:MAG: globin [Bacteroidota bacterium]